MPDHAQQPTESTLMTRMGAHHIMWLDPGPDDKCTCGAPAIFLLACSHCTWSEPCCMTCAPHGGA